MLQPLLNDLLELRHQAQAIGLASRHPVNSVLCGLYASVFRGQGMDFEEVREYREGDEIRNMDWRVTARTGVPHLKVFREERQRSVMLCVDVGAHTHFGTQGTFKNVQAAKIAALLGWSASVNQDRVGGLLFGSARVPGSATEFTFFHPSRERRALWPLLRALTEPSAPWAENEATSTDGPTDPLPAALDKLGQGSPTGALLLVIADFNRNLAALEQALGRLRQRHEVVLFPLDDLADHTLPDIGPAWFIGPDGHRVLVDTSNPVGLAHYRQQWEERRSHLSRIGKRLGVDVLPIATHEDAHRALVTGLRRRMRRLAARSAWR